MASRRKIHFNAPVILGFTLISFIILVLSNLTAGRVGGFLAVRYTSWLDPLMYLRMITHVVTHQTLAHFSGNIMLMLLVGPMVEEKYGSRPLFFMILITALLTGLLNVLLFPNTALLGASGIVFMLILLASFVNVKEGTIPLTVILVAVLYLGNEIVGGIVQSDNISQITHIVGGLCGAGFGYFINKNE